jgi:hypothetical protein
MWPSHSNCRARSHGQAFQRQAVGFLTFLFLILDFATGQTDASKWKTFSNRAGWSIDYPADWKISSCHACPDPAEADVFVNFFPPTPREFDKGSLMIVPLVDKPAGKGTEEWFSEVKKTHNLNTQIKEESLTLNNLPALKVRYRNPSGLGYEMETTYVISNSKTFAISFQGGKPGSILETLGNYPIYLRMLSTFRINRWL